MLGGEAGLEGQEDTEEGGNCSPRPEHSRTTAVSAQGFSCPEHFADETFFLVEIYRK